MAAAQREIAAHAETQDRLPGISIIAGADTSMKWRDSHGPIHAAMAPMHWPSREELAATAVTLTPELPYVPGYLGFREVPALLAAWRIMAMKPDLVVVDGHGRAHPRRCGIATHLGVLTDTPAIGCAKSILCGSIVGELGEQAGARAALVDRDELIGMALRLRARAQPVYVSSGHRLSLETAVEWIWRMRDHRRLPPPIRLAHEAANTARRESL